MIIPLYFTLRSGKEIPKPKIHPEENLSLQHFGLGLQVFTVCLNSISFYFPSSCWYWFSCDSSLSSTWISAIIFCHWYDIIRIDLIKWLGSFGASAVLIYGEVKSPLAQPRNLVGGHVFSAITGKKYFSEFSWNFPGIFS